MDLTYEIKINFRIFVLISSSFFMVGILFFICAVSCCTMFHKYKTSEANAVKLLLAIEQEVQGLQAFTFLT